MTVIKRDGREVDFDKVKISNAVLKAIIEVDGESTIDTERIAYDIADRIEEYDKSNKLTVEQIQDMVEVQLMLSYRKDIAKAYILYRDGRTKIRERNSNLIQKVMVRADSKVNVRSNANVDELSFSGREKEASAEIGKSIALDFDGLSHDVAEAHKQMLVYQHDLEKAIYGVHNCLNLNFQEIFTYGFRTRNGDVRPPTSFSTACQLYAVAFQCQSQVQFGGVGSIHTDLDLAPFVKLSFYKHFADGIVYLDHYSREDADWILDQWKNSKRSIDDPYFKKSFNETVYQYAMDMLEREGKQAAQGLYHNLNTLESRQGSQVPFTSINLGRDTSFEGRLVTKSLSVNRKM